MLAAIDGDTLEPLDPSGYAVDTDDGYDGYGDDEQLAALLARQDELEQLANTPRETVHRHVLEEAPPSDEAWAARVQREIENVEASIGRRLSDREAFQLVADHHGDHAAGVETSMVKSAFTVDFADTSTHEGRVQRAMDSIADSERRETGADFDPDPRPWHEPRDGTERSAREARALNHIDHNITSSQQRELDEQDQYLEEDYYQ